jgi:hypothetical protein
MSSLSILRFFLGPPSPGTPQKSKKLSSPEDREIIRTVYNKTAYERDAVTILLIKTRTENLDIPLFDRISFKNVAVAKALYACLSNTKKTQYKTQTEQVIRSFLDTKDVFNRWLSQFRAGPAVNANLNLISQ